MLKLKLVLALALLFAYANSQVTLYNSGGNIMNMAYETPGIDYRGDNADSVIQVHFSGRLAVALQNGQTANLICFATGSDFVVQDGAKGFIQQFGCLGLNNRCAYNYLMQSYFFASDALVDGTDISFEGGGLDLSAPNVGVQKIGTSTRPDTAYSWTQAEFDSSNLPAAHTQSYYRCYFKSGVLYRNANPLLDIVIDSSWGTQGFVLNP